MKIKTKQLRRGSFRGVPIEVQAIYIDEPANIDTWDRNAELLAEETGIDELDIHVMLYRLSPDRYGPIT